MTTSKSSKSSPSPKPASTAPKEATLSRFQSFRMERVHRRKLKGAPYNPRVISDVARKRLERALETIGLAEPVIWNERTGFVVGGHQRLGALDALEGSDDYLLDVAVVDLSEKQERELNIALNNPNLQGEYDTDLLAQLLKTPDLDLDATGFDVADVQILFDDPELATLFVPNDASSKALDEVAKQQQAAKTKQRLQKERTEDKQTYEDREDTETYAVVVFKTREERAAFAAHLGYTDEDKYLDGGRVMAKLEAAIPKPKAGRSGGKGSPPPASPSS